MVLQAYYASPLYWVGAAVVFFSFVVVNHESEVPSTESDPGKSLGNYEVVPGRSGEV